MYDFVIVDNPPVSIVTDGVISGRSCDTNLFVVRQGYSHKTQVKFIDQLAEKNNLPQICVVLNDVEHKNYGYGRGYGYQNYSQYGGYYDDLPKPKGLEKVILNIRRTIGRG